MSLPVDTSRVPGPHRGAGVLLRGPAPDAARGALMLLHGRGGVASDMLRLAAVLQTDDLLVLAPQAAGNSWYPHSFLAPVEANRDAVESAHALLEAALDALRASGLDAGRTAIVGFSQGACLAADHAARFPRRYGFVGALTGGLIGPPGARFAFPGSLDGAPVFLGASDPDPHVPWMRVEETAAALRAMGADVAVERYPGAPHAVLPGHIEGVRRGLREMLSPDQRAP